MKLFFKILLSSSIILAFVFTSNAQDPTFSQITNQPVYFNPAYTGLVKGMSVKMTRRNQWVKIPDGLEAYNFSLDLSSRKIQGVGGFGLVFSSDRAGGLGFIKTTSVGAVGTVRIPIQENMVTQFGVQATYVSKSPSNGDYIFSSQLDRLRGKINPSTFVPDQYFKADYPDLSIGLLLAFTENTFTDLTGTIGIGVHHLLQPEQSFLGSDSKLPRRYVVNGDITFDFGNSYNHNRKNKLKVATMYENQAAMTSIYAGATFLVSPIYLGGWFRKQSFELVNSNAVVMLAGIRFPLSDKTAFKLMYSYDFILSELQTDIGSSHEISLILNFDEVNLFGGTSGYNFGRGRSNSIDSMERF